MKEKIRINNYLWLQIQDCITKDNVLPEVKIYVKIKSSFHESQVEFLIGESFSESPRGFHATNEEHIHPMRNLNFFVIQLIN